LILREFGMERQTSFPLTLCKALKMNGS
jgi:hypothetical protein